jgi:hypothetical protein
MSPFITENDNISINIYFIEKDGNIEIVDTFEENKNISVMEFIFRKPSYKDSYDILKEISNEGNIKSSVILQDVVLRKLLVDWSAVDTLNKKIEINDFNISKLYPVIARKVTELLLQKIQL